MQKISLFALLIIFTINVACSPSILTERINTSKYPNMVISSEIHAKGNGIKLIGTFVTLSDTIRLTDI